VESLLLFHLICCFHCNSWIGVYYFDWNSYHLGLLFFSFEVDFFLFLRQLFTKLVDLYCFMGHLDCHVINTSYPLDAFIGWGDIPGPVLDMWRVGVLQYQSLVV
jgi:hypothetical protein